MHIWVYILYCLWEESTSKDTPQAIRTPGTVILVSKYHYPTKETGLLGEIVDSKAGTKNRKDEPRLSCGTRK